MGRQKVNNVFYQWSNGPIPSNTLTRVCNVKGSTPEDAPADAVVPGIWDAVRKGDTVEVLAQLALGASIDEADSEGENNVVDVVVVVDGGVAVVVVWWWR